MPDRMTDSYIRRAAFDWLSQQLALHGDVLPRNVLAQGFDFRGERVPLLGPQGIFKPRIMGVPLSITTIPSGPYEDGFSTDGLLRYRYRGTNPEHVDNRGLRHAMLHRIPLVYFFRIVKAKYLAVWPVFIVGDNPETLTFMVEVDDAQYMSPGFGQQVAEYRIEDDATAARRSYITASVRQRLHQRSFRERVLRAYQEQCAMCRLRHEELLDAAHIIPDSAPGGEPLVRNGLALCKLHHAAFDRQFIGIRPDYVIEVRKSILEESDGPMLLHGLKGMHEQKLWVPRSKDLQPDAALLAQRYERFLTT
ncbi:MAG: HNH endonuclease [Proteobacteria bacterium]|nr:MAG: HNH endonuclease [Pseudomonadota bacterium]QKK10792.1 MAG: HNH endonuclease [Pseudomonadota bacterium]